MGTTIQVSNELLGKLKHMKMHNKESYEDIIQDLIEDRLEFSDKTKRAIVESEKEIKKGKFTRLEDLEKELGLNV